MIGGEIKEFQFPIHSIQNSRECELGADHDDQAGPRPFSPAPPGDGRIERFPPAAATLVVFPSRRRCVS